MKTVLFDLDGTLIDHFTTIHRRCRIYSTATRVCLSQTMRPCARLLVALRLVTLAKLLGEGHASKPRCRVFQDHFEANHV